MPVDRKTLRRQVLDDLNRCHVLILEYADGNMSVKAERDRLQAKVTQGLKAPGRMVAGERCG